jgi:hypothetical protein
MDKTSLWEMAIGQPQVSDVLGAALIGGGVGAGARGIKQLYDIYRKKDLPPTLPAIPNASAKLPVEVSPDEAAELERGGVQVKHADSGLAGGFLQGLTVMPAAYLGWQGMDSLFGQQRKALAQKRLQRAQDRLSGLMADNPLPQDAPIHGAMKVAEAEHLKQAATGLGWYLGAPLGLSAGLLGVSAYNEARQNDRYRKGVSAIRDYLQRQATTPAEAELEPVVHDRGPAPKTDMTELGRKVAQALAR